MPAALDITGQRFGRLVAVRETSDRQCGKVLWEARCDCGATVLVVAGNLRSGNTRSCGCLQRDTVVERNTTHGLRAHPVYRTWVNMRDRCANPRNQKYRHYGGRGITVDPRWDDFATFLADVGEKPSPRYTLDRIDNDGPYSPENCRWATQTEQTRNTRRNRVLTLRGVSRPLSAWAEVLGISYNTLHGRITRLGWSVEKALTTPVRTRS